MFSRFRYLIDQWLARVNFKKSGFFYSLNVHNEGRAPLLRASLSTVGLAVTPLLGEELHESGIEGRRVQLIHLVAGFGDCH